MKKYRLIKQYPGSPKVGDIVQGKGTEGWYTKGPGHATYDWTQVVHYPEYWEEIVEKDYEVILARRVPYTILSIKRLSDGEVFSVGDLITGHSYTDARVIKKIKIRYDETIQLEQKFGNTDLAYATKVKQPLFLTHDGKDIAPGHKVWYVNKKSFDHSYIIASSEIKFNSDLNAYFLTKKDLETYLINNKPCLSLKDCCEVFECVSITQGSALMEKVKQKLGIK